MKLPTLRAWACPAACLAMALVVAGVAAAQNEQDQRDQDEDQQQQQSYDQSDRDRDSQRDEQDRDRRQQDRQRDEQDRQRQEQERQRDQQQRQRDQQNQQRDQQDRQRDQQDQQRDQRDRQRYQQTQQWDQQDRQRSQQTQWDEGRTRQRESSGWPEPTRYGSQQQTRYDTYGQRQSSQFDRGSNEQDAGLGVYIISDGGQGVLVTQVNPGSPAEEMGLRPNDRITQINGQRISSDQQFISRIRNMNPGDEVELEVLRDRSERIVRGELESRQEALVLSNRRQGQSWQQGSLPWQQGSENWQTGYQEGGFQQQGRTIRGGDFNNRISSIEQQVNRLSRELEQIRYALQDLRQGGESGQISRFGRSGETQAGYDEFQSGRYQDGRTRTQQRDDQSDRFRGEFRGDQSRQGGTIFRDTRQGQSFQDSGQFDGEFDRSRGGRSTTEGGTDTEGGVTGSLRTRPQNDQNWSDRQ